MITLKRHRAADIEAPFLHSDNENTTWKAHLFNHDDPSVITVDVVGEKVTITITKEEAFMRHLISEYEYRNHAGEEIEIEIIVFTFSIDQIDLFADGDKLDIEIWPTDNDTDMYWEEKAFRVEDSQVPVEE